MLRNLDWDPPALRAALKAMLPSILGECGNPDRAAAFAGLYAADRKAAAHWLPVAVNDDLTMLDHIWMGATLIRISAKYPNSRYARGCREYAAIRGHAYLGESSHPWVTERPLDHRPFPPPIEAVKWRSWLRAYPDHPGADDAAYWLGRDLQWQSLRYEALREFADLIERPVGDGDMLDNIRGQFVRMLDIGVTDNDLRRFLSVSPNDSLAPAVQYALAVHLAREQRYAEALRMSNSLPPLGRRTESLGFYWSSGNLAARSIEEFRATTTPAMG